MTFTQVTPQSPEFIPSKLNSSPNFYSPYASAIGSNVTPVKPSNAAPSLSANSYSTVTPIKGMSTIENLPPAPFN